jgi:membrane-associated protein
VSGLLDSVLTASPALVYLVVTALVFAEDAIFVGFVIPGETAAVLGGVAAARGNVGLGWMLVAVVLAAIVGDSVGYEVGRAAGPRILRARVLDRHRDRIDGARDLLARRGSAAVFLGRSVAFFRAVMPALAGMSMMPYRRFLVANAAGGIVWGVATVLLGYLAGNSYERVEKAFGRGAAVALAVVVIAAVLAWVVRRRRAERPE